MNLIEFDAKGLLARHGLPIPRGVLVAPGDELPAAVAAAVAVKAQIFAGGRGKAGLVRLCDSSGLAAAARDVRAAMAALGAAPYMLVEEQVPIERELYLAIRIDDVSQRTVIVFSAQGGIEVERSGAATTFELPDAGDVRPDHLAAFFRSQGLEGRQLGAVCRFAARLHQVFLAEDAELLEINPLAVTGAAGVVALDAKCVLDGAAAFRHGDREQMVSATLARQARSPLEARAEEHELTFVPLAGEVALLTGGAGNGMMVLDAIADAGYSAANFVDTVGGSTAARWQQLAELVFEHAREPSVRAIVAYFTLSATPLRSLVDGLLAAVQRVPPPKPLVIGVMASGASEATLALPEAQRILRDAGLDCLVELPDVVQRLQQTIPPAR